MSYDYDERFERIMLAERDLAGEQEPIGRHLTALAIWAALAYWVCLALVH